MRGNRVLAISVGRFLILENRLGGIAALISVGGMLGNCGYLQGVAGIRLPSTRRYVDEGALIAGEGTDDSSRRISTPVIRSLEWSGRSELPGFQISGLVCWLQAWNLYLDDFMRKLPKANDAKA